MVKACFCAGCKTGYLSDRKKKSKEGKKMTSLFKAPKRKELFEMWRKAIPRLDKQLSETDRVCALHFKKEDIITHLEYEHEGILMRHERQRAKLRPGAIPCIFLPKDFNSTEKIQKLSTVKKPHIKKKLDKHKVFGVGVDIESKSREDKEMVLDQGPSSLDNTSNQETLDQEESPHRLSSEEILNDEEMLSSGEEEAHVSDNDSIGHAASADEHYVTSPVKQSAETSVSYSPIIQTAVKDNFPKADKVFFVKNANDMQNILNYLQTGNILQESSKTNPCDLLTEKEQLTEDQTIFNFLKDNLHVIEKITPWWSISGLEEYIACARWNSDYDIDRKIIIKADLSVKVFLEGKISKIGRAFKVQSLDDISKLMFRVERTIVCPSIHINEGKCDGYLQGTLQCKKHNLCNTCIIWEKEKVQLEKERRRKAKDQIELMTIHFSNPEL